jgi:hypothetical protein
MRFSFNQVVLLYLAVYRQEGNRFYVPDIKLTTINFLTSSPPSWYLQVLGVFRILALCVLYTGRLGSRSVRLTRINLSGFMGDNPADYVGLRCC